MGKTAVSKNRNEYLQNLKAEVKSKLFLYIGTFFAIAASLAIVVLILNFFLGMLESGN